MVNDRLLSRFDWYLGLGYDTRRAWDGVLEELYYDAHGQLPDNHYVIDRVELVGDSRLFIHSDPRKENLN